MSTSTPAVVLLSGGLDSATCLAIAVAEGHRCHCLSFAYGQRHAHEITAARNIAAAYAHAVESHRVVKIDLGVFGGSALTDQAIAVPKSDVPFAPNEPHDHEPIPVTYVPARNTVFLSYALALAEVTDARAIYVGVNAVDYSGYPDCRPEYIEAFQKMADLATRAGVEGHGPRIIAPLITLKKVDIIRRGLSLGLDYGLTHSCYDPQPSGKPCGRCDSCRIRIAAFAELKMTDPSLRGE